MIGDIGDLTPIDKNHVFLSSVLWTFTNAYKAAIADINKGTYGTHGLPADPQERRHLAARTKYIPTARVEGDRQGEVGIVSGTIKVPNVTTKAAVLKLIG